MDFLELIKLCMVENKKIRFKEWPEGKYIIFKEDRDGIEYFVDGNNSCIDDDKNNLKLYSYSNLVFYLLKEYFQGNKQEYQWEIYEKTFDWKKVTLLLKEGKSVSNENMFPFFIKTHSLEKNFINFFHSTGQCHHWIPNLNDFERQDWFEVT
jgi:hypothetical protein